MEEQLVPSSGVARSNASHGPQIALWMTCAVACALFVVGAIRFYFGPAFALLMNSDAAVPVLLANEVLHTGSPLPATWYFGNDEIWTLAPHVFAIPFVAVLGVSTLALKLGNLLCLAFMLFFVTLPLHRVTRSWAYSILVAAGALAAFSTFQMQLAYEQAAYGWFCAEFALLLYLALRMQDDQGPEPWRLPGGIRWTSALYVLFVLSLTVESPLRVAVYWLAPFAAVGVVFPLSPRRTRVLVVTTAVAFIAGAILHFAVSRHLLTQAGLATSLIKPVGEWARNIVSIAQSLPVLIGYSGKVSATPFDALGAARICFFAVAVIVVMFAPAGAGPGSAECRFFARLCGAMLLVTLATLTVGRLTIDASVGRYLMPPALLCLAAFMAIVWCRFRAKRWGIAAIAAVFVLAFCGGAVARVSRFGPIAFERDCDAPANICRLGTALAAARVRHGYATYWNANATTLVSHGEIMTCGVHLKPYLGPSRWLVSKDCFEQPTEDRYFLALTRTEIAQSGRDFLLQKAGTPDQILTGSDYEIWIYATASGKLEWLRR